jgi:hypothetical protein
MGEGMRWYPSATVAVPGFRTFLLGLGLDRHLRRCVMQLHGLHQSHVRQSRAGPPALQTLGGLSSRDKLCRPAQEPYIDTQNPYWSYTLPAGTTANLLCSHCARKSIFDSKVELTISVLLSFINLHMMFVGLSQARSLLVCALHRVCTLHRYVHLHTLMRSVSRIAEY